MIKKCTGVIVDWLIKCGAVEEADKGLYGYAVYSLLLTLSPLLLAICFGLVMGRVWQNIVMIVPFMMIRKFSGGYHAKHEAVCLVSSCLLLFLCMVLSFYIKCGWGLGLLTAASSISLVTISPIDSENRLLSKEERISYKKTTIIMVTVFLLIDALSFLAGLHTFAICVSIGIMLSAFLQIPSALKGLQRGRQAERGEKQ